MTPWQFRVCLEAAVSEKEELHDHDVWVMYHGALLNRWPGKQAFPDLKRFLSGALKPDKKVVSPIDESAIKSRLRAYQHIQENKGKK